jgi:uncharacterized repeat protein (TIGR01451 family)
MASSVNSHTSIHPVFTARRVGPADVQPTIFLHQYPRTTYAIQGRDTSFTMVLSNTGNITLTNAFVQDDLVPDCNRTVGDLPPKSGIWYTCTAYNVKKSFDNTSSARAWPLSGMYAADSDQASIITVAPSRLPAIQINQDPGRIMVLYGANAHFWMSIINRGPITLTNITVSNPTVSQCDGYHLAQLEPYQIAYYYCEQPTPSASFYSTATVTAQIANAGATLSNTNVTHIVMSNTVLLSEYHVNSDTVRLGDQLTFVENARNIMAISGTNVILSATIPPGSVFVRAEGGIYSDTLAGTDAPGIYWSGDVPANSTYAMTLTVQVTQTDFPLHSFGRASISGEEISARRLEVNANDESADVIYYSFLPLAQR